MEINCRRKNSSSGEMFSFPVISPPAQNSDQFEFGPVTTPGSSPDSPADNLFFNGKLLPHSFPIQTPNFTNFSYSRSTSRTCSICSKDSLMSSRSNSTNSRSSSARTSVSEISAERKLPSSADGSVVVSGRISVRRERNRNVLSNCQYQCYGYSQRWQLIAAAPALKHQGSRSRKVDVLERKGSKKSMEKSWLGGRILKAFVSACKECHAIETS